MVVDIPLSEIFSDDVFNCRGAVIPFSVIELAKSIKKDGLLQPIVVQPYKCDNPKHKWRIVVGHRRFMAFRVNKETTIPAIIKEGLSDIQAFTLNLEENIQRKDLTILQEAKALKRYLDWGYGQEQTALLVNKTAPWVAVRFMLLAMPEDIQAEAEAGILTQDNIRQIAKMNPEQQYEAVRNIKDAKVRGQKLKLRNPNARKTDPFARKVRSKYEIQEMLDMIYDGLGPGITTRALAWAAGNISNIEFLQDVQKEAIDNCLEWTIPENLVPKGLINAGTRSPQKPVDTAS